MDSAELNDVRAWVRDSPLALLVFTTPDCGVCNALKPRVEEMARSYPRLVVRYVNLEQTPDVAGQYGVFVVPVYVLSVAGREAVRFARHFSMHELESTVARYNSLLEDA